MSNQKEKDIGEDRVPIWSVGTSFWPWFAGSAIVLFAGGVGFYFCVYLMTEADWKFALIQIIKSLFPIGLASAIAGYFITGGIELVASWAEYLRQRAKIKLQEAEDRGIGIGEARGYKRAVKRFFRGKEPDDIETERSKKGTSIRNGTKRVIKVKSGATKGTK